MKLKLKATEDMTITADRGDKRRYRRGMRQFVKVMSQKDWPHGFDDQIKHCKRQARNRK